ncbi:hypothetical protein LTS08_008767 [Lithohypha guttulata]|nr:hypothetical protein LTS08_008767 [Lithohypha guttulata]
MDDDDAAAAGGFHKLTSACVSLMSVMLAVIRSAEVITTAVVKTSNVPVEVSTTRTLSTCGPVAPKSILEWNLVLYVIMMVAGNQWLLRALVYQKVVDYAIVGHTGSCFGRASKGLDMVRLQVPMFSTTVTSPPSGSYQQPPSSTMQQPLDRPCYFHCYRHPEAFHPQSMDESGARSTASTVSTATDTDDARESDEEFVEVDSEAGHSAEEYRDQTIMSEGSSEHWNDELEDEDDGAKHHEDNEHAGTGDADDDAPVNVSHVLDATPVHESPLVSLSAVLRSLNVRSRDAVHHARDARGGGAYTSASPEHSTSKRGSKRGNNEVQ